MTIVTKQEFIDFIRTQPEEKRINFWDDCSNSECGCPMVHFGLAKKWEFMAVSCEAWFSQDVEDIAKFEEEFDFSQFCPGHPAPAEMSYGELKRHLRIKGGALPILSNTLTQTSTKSTLKLC